jgi:hypothetical protein
MLDIKFEFEDSDDELTGLNMGHMTFSGDQGSANSKMKKPSQAMIVLISISELLDGLQRFFFSNDHKYEFVGMDSSFIVNFEKNKDDLVTVTIGETMITKSKKSEIANSVLRDVNNFLSTVLSRLPKDDIAYDDLITSVEGFKTMIKKFK